MFSSKKTSSDTLTFEKKRIYLFEEQKHTIISFMRATRISIVLEKNKNQMKKITNYFSLIVLLTLSNLSESQTLTGLVVDFKGTFDNTKSIYVTPLAEDKVQAVELLKTSLITKGLKLASTLSDADYMITLSVNKPRKEAHADCKMSFYGVSGNIMDTKTNSGIIGTFVFSQSSFESNCPSTVFNDLAGRLKGHEGPSSKMDNSAKTSLTMSDVYSAKELIFYGFDFTNFRLIDEEYLSKGAEIRDSYFSAWNSYPLSEIPVEKMQRWFDKTKITYNPVAVTMLNIKVSPDILVQKTAFTTSKEAIAKSIASYEKPSNSNIKIGYVVNVEYFNKETRTTSAFVTFFEISSGAIISSENFTIQEASGKGLTAYWGESLTFVLIRYYKDKYHPGQKQDGK